MKMDDTSKLIAAGIGLVTLIIWVILPVLSFVFVIPLYLINGFWLAYRFNQLGILLMLFPLLMILMPLSGDKKLTIGAGVLNMIMCLAVFFARKALIVHGNLGWLFKSASALISALGSFLNVTITEANISTYIDVACENFLVGGLGLWLSLVASVIYVFYVTVFGNQVKPTPINKTQTSSQQISSKATAPSKGFSHRT